MWHQELSHNLVTLSNYLPSLIISCPTPWFHPVWPDWVKFSNFGKIFNVFGKDLRVYLVFGNMINLLWQICLLNYCTKFQSRKWPNFEKNYNHLVTLVPDGGRLVLIQIRTLTTPPRWSGPLWSERCCLTSGCRPGGAGCGRCLAEEPRPSRSRCPKATTKHLKTLANDWHHVVKSP